MPVEPRAHTPRSDRPTHGGRVAKIAAAKGRPLMPWQRAAADVALELDQSGFYRYRTVIISVPRQAGKTDLEGHIADARCMWHKNARVRITMQDGKTADEWMREQHFESLSESPVLAGRYTESRRAGAHGVRWPHSRSTFTTFPPIRKALHSKQSDVVFVDEAWAHDAEAGQELKQAIRPTLATRDRVAPGPQLYVVSTRGDDRSPYLDEYLARGAASIGDPDTRTAFIDYGIGPDDDPEDLDVIAAHHPAAGLTITRASLEDALEDFRHPDTRVLDVAGFARAYGNRASNVRTVVFPDGVWTTAARGRQPVPDRVGLALDVTPTGDRFALGAGWRVGDDGYVELIAADPMTRDTHRLVASVARARGVPLYVDRQAQAALEVVDRFAELDPRDRPDVVFLNTAQYGSACVAFSRGIYNDSIHHPNDPDLDAAVKVATKRDLPEGGFGWGRAGSAGSIAELVAVTIALRGFDVLPAPKRKPVAIAGRR